MEKRKESKVEDRRISYEELENVCHQLSEQSRQLNLQNQQLKEALTEANLTNLYKRLDYLFEIVNRDNQYFTKEFKQDCASEIEGLMARPEEPETETTNTEKK